MHDLKFRVWDKKVHPAQMYVDPYFITPTNLRLSDAMKKSVENGWVWMRFTGRKDEKGIDIYESDIVKFESCCGEEPEIDIGVIEWNEKSAAFCVLWPEYGRQGLYHVEIEVIGNIYEHPELLSKIE